MQTKSKHPKPTPRKSLRKALNAKAESPATSNDIGMLIAFTIFAMTVAELVL